MNNDTEHLEQLVLSAYKRPVRPGLTAFIGRSGGQFIDNVKYAFLECRQSEHLDCFFVTAEPRVRDTLQGHGLSCYLFPEEDAVLALAQAQVLVADDFHYKFNMMGTIAQRAKVVQLWHGIPLKKIGYPELARITDPDKAEMIRQGYSGYHVVASSSDWFTKTCFAPAFPDQALENFGLPRNDVLFREPTPLDRLGTSQAYDRLAEMRAKGTKVLVYLPTFRDTGGDPISDKALDFKALAHFCERHDLVLVFKFHPYIRAQADFSTPRLLFLDPTEDIYPYLGITDCLLTDYSSIYFDFLLLDRPIVFYPYDLDKYMSVDRELFFPYEQFTPGPSCRDFPDLVQCLRRVLAKGEDEHHAQRKALRDKAFAHPDGNSAVRVRTYLEERFSKQGARP